MSNTLRFKAISLAALTAIASASPAYAQMGSNAASTAMLAQQPSEMNAAIARWELLQQNRQLRFADYAGFAMRYPDFPRMSIVRTRAENALVLEAPPQADILAFFDALPPITNAGRARYALALAGAQRPEALEVARQAWRGGEMSDTSEAYITSIYAGGFAVEDHVERMDALLWQGDRDAAVRLMVYLDPPSQALAKARLALVSGSRPEDAGVPTPPRAVTDPGYVYNYVNYLRKRRNTPEAIALLANRPNFTKPAFDPEDLVAKMLSTAKSADAMNAVRIASKIDDLFAPGTDISQGTFRLRDKYTDLMWLGGTKALWSLGRADQAVGLFERYGRAARSPLTKAKGYYWAGRAAQRSGQMDEARRLYQAASQWPDYYYGQLSLAALGQPMPQFSALPPVIGAAERQAFEAKPLAQAIIAMSQNRRDWRTERYFFQAVGDAVANDREMLAAHDLALRVNLPELAVVLGMKAGERGFQNVERVGYPVVQTPVVNDWVMTHAISRQESEFDRTRRSHAGARGMMQLMPATAREQARKMGLAYQPSALFSNPQYNIRLGDGYFARMLEYYGGSYPLAVAAYNAGPGNVNKWLRRQGDPRTGAIDWQTWIERIEFTETRYYVMRVLGNAVTYSHMYPETAGLPRPVNTFLR